MGMIYERSALNIAAVRALDTNHGFLHPYGTSVADNTAYKIGWHFYNDVDKAELNSRGWVFQERILSRRTVFFTDQRIYWECAQSVRTEKQQTRPRKCCVAAEEPSSYDLAQTL